MAKTRLRLVSPATVKRTSATPRRRPNAELRPREHLTEREVEKLIEAAKGNRHGGRDSAMILVCFRHGLRASEVVELQWSDMEFETGTLHLRRAKGGWNRDASVAGRRTAGTAGAQTRGQVALHLRQRTGRTILRVRLAEDGRAGWDRGQDAFQGPSSHAQTCPTALRWQIRERTQERCKPTLGIAAFNRQCVTPNWHQGASKTCGDNRRHVLG